MYAISRTNRAKRDRKQTSKSFMHRTGFLLLLNIINRTRIQFDRLHRQKIHFPNWNFQTNMNIMKKLKLWSCLHHSVLSLSVFNIIFIKSRIVPLLNMIRIKHLRYRSIFVDLYIFYIPTHVRTGAAMLLLGNGNSTSFFSQTRKRENHQRNLCAFVNEYAEQVKTHLYLVIHIT